MGDPDERLPPHFSSSFILRLRQAYRQLCGGLLFPTVVKSPRLRDRFVGIVLHKSVLFFQINLKEFYVYLVKQ